MIEEMLEDMTGEMIEGHRGDNDQIGMKEDMVIETIEEIIEIIEEMIEGRRGDNE